MSYRNINQGFFLERIALLEEENNSLRNQLNKQNQFFPNLKKKIELNLNNIILFSVLALCITISTIFLGSTRTVILIIRLLFGVISGTSFIFRFLGKLLMPFIILYLSFKLYMFYNTKKK